MEVVTPVLGHRGTTDPHIESMVLSQGGQTFFLQTSPEFAMKRLLAAGSGAIYQLCPSFRWGETGRQHNPEFSLLEWYRPSFSPGELMTELGELLSQLCIEFEVNFEMPEPRTYKDLFQNRFDLNPHSATVDELYSIANDQFKNLVSHLEWDDEGRIDDIRDLLFSTGIEPTLEDVSFVTNFPSSQAALAKTDAVDGDLVALRFELYWQGVELANGYDELKDPEELIRRTSIDNSIRQSRNLPLMEIDDRLLEAMTLMPECSGVAVGIDRLQMLLTGKSSLREVMSFTMENS